MILLQNSRALDILIRNADTTEEFDRIMSLDGQFRASKISPEYNTAYSMKMFGKSNVSGGASAKPVGTLKKLQAEQLLPTPWLHARYIHRSRC